MKQEYEILVRNLSRIFGKSEAVIRRHLHETTMPGSTPLQTARGLLKKVKHNTPRGIANIVKKNGKAKDIPYDALLATARAIHREAKFGNRKHADGN